MDDQGDGKDNKEGSYEQPPAIIQPLNPQPIPPPISAAGVGNAGDPAIHEREGARNIETKPTHAPRDVNAGLMTFLTAIIAVATAINVWLFYMESESTSKQIDKLTDKAGSIVASMNTALSDNRTAISNAFRENKDALDTNSQQTRRALDASIIASNNTLRPYVYVATLAMRRTVAEGQRMQGEGGVFNAGHTPAIRTTVCADLVVLGSADNLGDDYPCPSPRNPRGAGSPTHSIAVIGPGNPPVLVRSPGTTANPGNQPAGTFERLISSGALRMYFYGDITYYELLSPKNMHRSQFCGVYEPVTREFNVCEHHTQVD